MSSRTAKGLTLIELVVSLAVLSSLGIVLAALLRGAFRSSRRSAEQAFLLAGARKALMGAGPAQPGVLDGVDLAARPRPAGAQELSFSYYERDSNYHLVESTTPSEGSLLLVSFTSTGRSRKLKIVSGATLEGAAP